MLKLDQKLDLTFKNKLYPLQVTIEVKMEETFENVSFVDAVFTGKPFVSIFDILFGLHI